MISCIFTYVFITRIVKRMPTYVDRDRATSMHLIINQCLM